MVKKIKLAIAGCTGRMGKMIAKILPEYKNFELSGLLEKSGHPDLGTEFSKITNDSSYNLKISDSYSETLLKSDVLIDFTLPDATLNLLECSRDMEVRHVIGTTGFSVSQESDILRYAKEKVIVKAGNMSLGVNLITKLTQMISGALDTDYDIEILEMHHREKVDSPSGTALMLGEAAAKGRGLVFENIKDLDRSKVRGKRKNGNIGLSAMRGGDVVGEHSIIFAGSGERIVISHIANDREIFARGALKAAYWTMSRKPGAYSMIDVLGI